jgi:hypothetical protein
MTLVSQQRDTWNLTAKLVDKTNSNILFQLADLGASSDFYRQFVKTQIDYILGDSGRSYVVGFGNNPPTHARHRSRYGLWLYPLQVQLLLQPIRS